MKKTHSETFTVRSSECDLYGRMRLDALFLSMQEVGEHHACELGVGHDAMQERGLFFALSRIHVRVASAPVCGQTITQTTWPGESNRFFCPRYHVFTAEDGTLLAAAGALWVMLDFEHCGIVSPLKLDLHFPDTRDLPAPVALPNRLPPMATDVRTRTRTPVYCDYDINGHVNNTKYIAWLCDTLGREALRNAFIGDIVAGYEKEIRSDAPLTESLSLRDGAFTYCVSSESGMKHFVAGGTLLQEVRP